MNQKAHELARNWSTNPYFDEATRAEIKALLDSNNEKEITERFYRDLEFGTGGLRSIIGNGSNRMNKYQVRRATQAVCNQIQKMNLPKLACVGYDSRRFSKEFAAEVAAVFAGNDFTVYLYDKMLPVPLLSYSVRYHKATAGVMITASHNPKEYNGYKLYWNDGCQVVPPVDQAVIDQYSEITDYTTIKYLAINQAIESKKIIMVGEAVELAYRKMLKTFAINPELCAARGNELKMVYTPIHGTGINMVPTALADLGLSKFDIVKEQEKPDENFSTVKSPNPENVEALRMATELMIKTNADLCFGTDPDCDRIGVIVNHHGKPEMLNGNQVAVLLLHYVLSQKQKQNKLPSNALVIKTIVTSELQTTIANHFKVNIENTLTGFKWMGLRLSQMDQKGIKYSFMFASEESYGYLGHDQVRDKDGVSASVLTAEMALYYKTQNQTLIDALDTIYQQFGFAYEGLLSIDYFGKEGAEKISRIMDHFRKFHGNILGEKIIEIEDYLELTKLDVATNKKTPIDQTKSNVIGFKFESGNKLYLRPSGTEPKIKFYTMVQEKTGSLENRKSNALKLVKDIENFIKKEVEPV